MARNKSRPRKGRPSKKKAGANSAAKQPATEATIDTAQEAPVIEGRPQETKKKRPGVFEFFQQVRNEGEKVTWTGRNETMISTMMVLVMVLIMVVFFFVVDQTLRFGICNILPINCAVSTSQTLP